MIFISVLSFFTLLGIVLLLGGLPKLALTRAVFIRNDEWPLRRLLYVIALEAIILSSILWLFFWPISDYPRHFGFKIIETALSFSAPMAVWFFKMFARSQAAFELSIFLLMLLPIYSIVAAIFNRKWLQHAGPEGNRSAGKFRPFVMGLMMPGFMVLFMVAYLSLPIGAMQIKASKNTSNKQRELNHLLIKASSQSFSGLGEILVNRGADVNARDEYGRSVLYRAFCFGYLPYGTPLKMVGLLLERGADVDAREKNGATVLMRVSEGWDRLEEYKLLLSKDPDVNAGDKSGMTALMKASFSNQLEKVRLLLEKGADVNIKSKSGKTALSFASKKRHLAVRDLLEGHDEKE